MEPCAAASKLAERCDEKLDPDVKAAAVLLHVNLRCSQQAHANIAALTPYNMSRREEALELSVAPGQRAFVLLLDRFPMGSVFVVW